MKQPSTVKKSELVALALAIRTDKTARLRALAVRWGVSVGSLRNWMSAVRGVDRADWAAALQPAVRPGARRSRVIPPAVWSGFKADFLRLEQPTMAACYRAAQRRGGGARLPSIATFRRRLAEECPGDLRVFARKGESAARAQMGVQQRSVEDLSAGEAVSGDGYKHNVFVVSADGEVYRPVTWAWQCIRSRKILAWRTDRSENKEMLRLSFADLCRAVGVPRHLVIDNTRAASNKWLTGGAPGRQRFRVVEEELPGIFELLGVQAHFSSIVRAANGRARGWGQAKPVERAFRDFDDFDRGFAGAYAGRNPQAKPDNYENAVVAEVVFKDALKEFLAEFNARPARRSHTSAGKSYDEIFAENYDPDRLIELTTAREMLLLLAAESRKVRADGTLTLAAGGAADCPQNIYGAPFLARYAKQNLVVRFNPEDLHAPVQVFDRAGKHLGEAACIVPVGFFDAGAARELQRYRRRRVAALREQLRAVRGEETAKKQLTQPRPARRRVAAAGAGKVSPRPPSATSPLSAPTTAGTSAIVNFYKTRRATMPDQIKIYSGGKADPIRDKIAAIIEWEGLSQRQIAEQAGVNSGGFSSYMKGKYKKEESIRGKLRQWLNLREEKKQTQSFKLDLHVADLSNTEKIGAVLQHAQTAAEMVCLYGGAGGGKTHSALRYATQYSNVFIVTAEPAMCSLSAVLREVAATVKVGESTCSIMSRDITATLVNKNALLIIDEAHHLSQRIFDQLRSIYDKINQKSNDFGLAFLGNEPLFQRLTTGPMMKQIYSRLGHIEEISAPVEADGALMLRAIVGGDISARAGVWAGQVVGGIGGIRALIKAVRGAVLATGKPIHKLSESDILSANR